MTKKQARELKKRGLNNLVPVYDESTDIIKKIAQENNLLPSDVIYSAVKLLEKSLGHEVKIIDDKEDVELSIKGYKKFKPHFKI